MHLTIYDPWANPSEVKSEYQIDTIKETPKATFDAIVLTVAHNEFIKMDLKPLMKKNTVVYDVKGVLGIKADAKL